MRAQILRHVASVARKEHMARHSGILNNLVLPNTDDSMFVSDKKVAKGVTHDAPKGVAERQVASYPLIEKKEATIEGEEDPAEVVEEEK